jgi:ATP-dependent DNA helicase RecQ
VFRPGQEELVRAVLEGRDALGILPTGGGKSVCFQLPAFLLSGTVLVLSPLISLMEDQVMRARKAGLRAELLTSSLPARERERVLARAAAGRVQLLLVSPERLLRPRFQAALPRLPLALIAVDEAHCISQWGHDFRPSYLRIGEVRTRVSAPLMALTATATPRVRKEIEACLGLRGPVRVVGSFDRPNLVWRIQKTRGHGHKLAVLGRALRGREGATIVYASTRRTVEAVRRNLAARGIPALSYHAALSPVRRSQVQDRFLHTPAPVVVATNAFGMGIDRPDVRRVVHFHLPGSLEAYYQEAGRAGRDGEPARCLALFGPGDRTIHDRFVATAFPHVRVLRRILRHLRDAGKPGVPFPVPVGELRGFLGGGAGEDEVLAALKALGQCGALEVEERAEGPGGDQGMSSPQSPTRAPQAVILRAGTPDLAGLEALRRLARERVEAVQEYARGRGCRRDRLLGYFGEVPDFRGCGACDGCVARWGSGSGRDLGGWGPF